MARSAITATGDGTPVSKRDPNGTDGAAAFVWPPALEVLGGTASELTRQDVAPNAPVSAVRAVVPLERPASAAPTSPAVRRQEEPRTASGRGLHQRAPTSKPPTKASGLSWSPWAFRALRLTGASLRSHAVPIALAAFALIAVVEGVVILRQLLPGPAGVAPQNPSTSSTATAVQAAPAITPETIVTTRPASIPDSSKTTVATEGRLVIRSEPAGAQVLIDGRSYGVTPVRLANVVPGDHQIVLRRNGTEVRQSVRIEPGLTVSLVVPLKLDAVASGWVAIESPIEVDLFEGGILLGTSRSRRIMVEAGTHTFQLVNGQIGLSNTQQVRVESGKVEVIAVELPQTTIHLNATPWAEVWIDGKSVGETPIGNLSIAIGPHEVVFRHPELGDKVISAVVKAGVPTRLTADLRRQ
jgi:PEGA domain